MFDSKFLHVQPLHIPKIDQIRKVARKGKERVGWEWIGKARSGREGMGGERKGMDGKGLEWFNVKECLPESNQEVLAFGATGMFIGIYRRKFIPLSEDAPS